MLFPELLHHQVVRRTVHLRLLLGDHDGNGEPPRERHQPRHTVDELIGDDQLDLVEELRLDIDDDEHAVVGVDEARHAPHATASPNPLMSPPDREAWTSGRDTSGKRAPTPDPKAD